MVKRKVLKKQHLKKKRKGKENFRRKQEILEKK